MKRATHSNFVGMDDGFDYEETGSGDPEDAYYPNRQTDHARQEGAPEEHRPMEISHNRRTSAKVVLGLVMLALLLGFTVWLITGRSSGDARKAYPITVSGTEVTGLSGMDTGPQVGALAPDFELADVNTGKMVKLSALRGRPVWLNYFATWCPPCKAELPDIKRAYAQHKEEGLAIVGIDMREEPALVKAFISANSYDWTFVVDSDGKVTNSYFVYGIPTHIFINKDGVIKAVSVGGLTPEAMEQNISMITGK